MEAFKMASGTLLAGTVVEDEDQTTTGDSLANTRYTMKDGMLGSLGSPDNDKDSTGPGADEEQDMKIELPAGGLAGMENDGDNLYGKGNGNDGSSNLNPMKLDLTNETAHEDLACQGPPFGSQSEMPTQSLRNK